MDVLKSKFVGDSNYNYDNDSDNENKIDKLYGPKGFFFQQRRGNLNLRALTTVNIDRLIRDVDIDLLQQHMENITFCNLQENDLRYLTDPQIVKLFKISQLTIEYLLYSQDQLVANLDELSKKYSSKKRSLLKKRRELTELNESTKQLRNQVKAKKQNIATLEELLKETNKAREKEFHNFKNKMVSNEEKPVQSRLMSTIINFFVTSATGLCIEFNERLDTIASDLIVKVKKVLDTKQNQQRPHNTKDFSINIIFRGKILMSEQTLFSAGINDGDTLLAVVEKEVEEVKEKEKPVETNVKQKEMELKEMLQFLSTQQESMREFAKDIKNGWENALVTLAQSNRPKERDDIGADLIQKIDGRWEKFESGVREQMEDKLDRYQILLAEEMAKNKNDDVDVPLSLRVSRRRLITGDLEDDPQDTLLQDINSNLRRSNNKLDSLENQAGDTRAIIERLQDTLRAQRQEMDDLRRMLAARGDQPAPQVTVIHETRNIEPEKPIVRRIEPQHSDHVPLKYNKWNMLASGAEPENKVFSPQSVEPAKKVEFVEEILPTEEVKEPEPEPKPEPEPVRELPKREIKLKPAAEPIVVKEPEPEPIVVKEPEPVEPTVSYVQIVFNSETSHLPAGISEIAVDVPSELSTDDIVFEIRKKAAVKAKVSLGKVLLKLHGKDIRLGLDLPEMKMTAEDAANLASAEELLLAIADTNPVTDSQIDMLVASWEKAVTQEREQISASSKKGTGERRLRKRDWNDDDEDLSDGLTVGKYKEVRGSLDYALTSLSDKEGLTDEELNRNMDSLKSLTSSLPKPVSDYMMSSRGSIAGAVSTASLEGNPLNYDSLDYDSDRPRLSRSLSVSKSMSVRTSFGNNPALLRLSSTAPGGSGARKHLLRRSIENYDEEDADYGRFLPDDTPMMASITNSVDINPRESISAFTPRTMNSAPMIARSADSKVSGSDSLIYSPSPSVSMNNRSRYSDADEIASELDSVSDNKSKGYTLTSSFDYTQEFSADGDEKAESKRPLGIGERDSVDSFKRAIRNEDKPTNRSGQDKHIPSNDSLESTRTFSNTGESDSTLHYTGGSNVDLSVTVDSNVDGLEGTNDFGASGVIRKADAYEKAAVDTMMTPPQNEERSAHSKNKQHGSSNYSKVSSSSPFGALRSDVQGFHSDIGDDFDESVNSLTLSDSHMDDDLE